MIPLFIVALMEHLAFNYFNLEANYSTKVVVLALIVFSITCGGIIFFCSIFEKPTDITKEIANINDERIPTYFEKWEGEPPFVVMYLIYGLIIFIALYLFSESAYKGEDFLILFHKYGWILFIIDVIITFIVNRDIAPNIPCSIIGMIHFETSYMLRIVWILAFIWGLLYFTVITLLVLGLVLSAFKFRD